MILVTGATGHIGNVLIRKLLKRKERVRAMVLPQEDRTALKGLDVDIVEGDVLDIKSLRQAMQGVDRVFHLAGMISIMPGEDPFVRMVNLTGTRNVVEVAKEMHVRRLIYTSSIHAIGAWKARPLMNRSDLTRRRISVPTIAPRRKPHWLFWMPCAMDWMR